MNDPRIPGFSEAQEKYDNQTPYDDEDEDEDEFDPRGEPEYWEDR